MSNDESPLRARRRRHQRYVEPPPRAPAEDPTLPSLSPPDQAYCPVLHHATGRPWCSLVDCGRCVHLEERLLDVNPYYLWVCSNCSAEHAALPFWTDGNCDTCGEYSVVLALAIPRDGVTPLPYDLLDAAEHEE